jgi:hypothetical protein
MGFFRDFGLPELLIIVVICFLPIGIVGGVVALVLALVKKGKKP